MEPDETVSEVLFPIINEQALQDLVREHHSSDRAVRTQSKDLSRVVEAGGQNGALSVTNVVTTAVRGDYERLDRNLDRFDLRSRILDTVGAEELRTAGEESADILA